MGQTHDPVVSVEHETAPGPALIVCEHASNRIPPDWGDLGLTEDQRRAHIAWDPGALGLARGIAQRLSAPLVHANVSRLVYDLNRPPLAPGAIAETSEIHTIPGNQGVTPAERLRRTESIYLPFHSTLHGLIARRIAAGTPPVIVTIHSFTPVYHGQRRAVEFGVIHDADPTLALLVLAEARDCGLDTRLNEPYSAADHVTHTLRLQATPYGLANVMLEIRNDLIASPEAEAAMADRLAPILARAIADLPTSATRAA